MSLQLTFLNGGFVIACCQVVAEGWEPEGKVTEALTEVTTLLSKPMSVVFKKKYAGNSCVGS